MKTTTEEIEIRTFIKERNREFEQMLLVTATWDEELFRKARPYLACDAKIRGKGMFEDELHEALYQALALINGRLLDSGGRMPIAFPTFELLRSELQGLMAKGLYVMEEEIPKVIQTYRDICEKFADQHSAQIARGGWRIWLGIRHKKIICRNALINPDIDVEKLLSDASHAVNGSSDDERILSFRQIASMQEEQVIRIPTGFTPLDRKLGGGFAKGEGALILGTSGCGKSICSTQFSVDMSSPLRGYKGLLIATEMEPEDYMRRIISNKLRIPYAQIKDGVPEVLLKNPDFKQRHDILMENLGKTLRFFRWRDHKGSGIFTAINDIIKRTQDEMGGLDFAHLDWLGGALGKDAYGTGREPRHVWQEGADSSAQLAGQHHIAMIVYAQAHPQNALNKKRVGAEMAAECKSLHRQMNTAIGISALHAGGNGDDAGDEADEKTYQDIQYFHLSKSRKSEGGTVPFRRNFAQMRIDPV